MIVFDLLCAAQHRFEGWFASADDFSSQKERSVVCCPVCGSAKVERVPSATRINVGAVEAPAPAPPHGDPELKGKDPFAIAQVLYSRMLDELLTKTEDVGGSFPAEARRIHYRETAARSIRGQATQDEHDALLEEGIPVARLPLPPTGSWN